VLAAACTVTTDVAFAQPGNGEQFSANLTIAF
jgi:hypothetical protein